MTFTIGIGPNNRKSCYFDATVTDGVKSFSVYNHMFIPAHFGDPAAEYDRLMNGVVMWDVAAQRQVEITGPDAGALIQYLTTRDMSATKVGQGRYVPLCDHAGNLINDPVLLKLDENRFWLSIADSDIALWASAIAAERGFDAQAIEPDVSPLAVQGPKAEVVIADLFGDWVRDLKYFGFKQTDLDGIPLVIARSGWSKQGGYELYLQDSKHGLDLWEKVKAAGQTYGIGPGAPNDLERLESGLVSYGADGRLQVNPCNPFEIGLGKLVDFDKGDFVGKAALQKIMKDGVKRRRVGFTIDGGPILHFDDNLPIKDASGTAVGTLSEATFSSRKSANIGVGMLNTEIADTTTGLTVTIEGDVCAVHPQSLPFF